MLEKLRNDCIALEGNYVKVVSLVIIGTFQLMYYMFEVQPVRKKELQRSNASNDAT